MTKKISYRLYSTLVAVFFLAITCYSQNDTPIIDSIIQEAAPAVEDDYQPPEDEGSVYYLPDTLKQQFRSVVYDSVQAINTDKSFYYKSYMDSLLRATAIKKEKPKRNVDLRATNFFNSVFGVIFWIVAIGLFGYLVYRLFLSNSAIFSRNRKNISSDVEVALSENTNDPDALLRNAIRNGNYRLAVRYLYLQVLTKLSERKIIEINSNKTNYEYVNEVRKHKFANEFASLTLQYEYVWYGEYPVNEKLFEQIQSSFNQFNKNLSR